MQIDISEFNKDFFESCKPVAFSDYGSAYNYAIEFIRTHTHFVIPDEWFLDKFVFVKDKITEHFWCFRNFKDNISLYAFCLLIVFLLLEIWVCEIPQSKKEKANLI